jgi:hypothetical protein
LKNLEYLKKELDKKNIEWYNEFYKLNLNSIIERWVYLKKILDPDSELNKIHWINDIYWYLSNIISDKASIVQKDFNLYSNDLVSSNNKKEIINLLKSYEFPDISFLSDYLWLIDITKISNIEDFISFVSKYDDKIVDNYRDYISSWKSDDKMNNLVYSIKFYWYYLENNIWYEVLPNIVEFKKSYELELKNLKKDKYEGINIKYLNELISILDDLINNTKIFINELSNNIILNNSHIISHKDIEKFSFPNIKNIKSSLDRLNFLEKTLFNQLNIASVILNFNEINSLSK